MPTPVIDDLPTPPSRADAANFAARGDAFLGALPTFVTQLNVAIAWIAAALAQILSAVASAVASPNTQATSTASLIMSTGSKTLTIQTGKSIVADMWVALTVTGDGTKWMSGPVTSYESTTGELVVNVQRTSGTGSYSGWRIVGTSPLVSDTVPRALAAGSTINDPSGSARAVGYAGMPTKKITTTYTVTNADVGFCLEIDTGGALVLPRNSTLAAGQQFSGGDVIIFQEIAGSTKPLSAATNTTLRQKGGSNTGARTIKTYGGGSVQLAGNLTDTWFVGGDLT